MNRKYESALKKAGMDTNQYFSLRIDKNEIPDGAEVVVQVRDRVTGELRPIPMGEAMDKYFAKNSRFYKQVMEDGHIFNPYIHRRFLPAQFKRNIREAGYNGIESFIQKHYGWNYVTRFLPEECAKLAMLERRDRTAFMERSRFFTLRDMQSILYAYVDEVLAVLDQGLASSKAMYTPNTEKMSQYWNGRGELCTSLKANRQKPPMTCNIKGIGVMKKDHIRPMKYRFGKFKEAIALCKSYADLSALMDGFDFCMLDKSSFSCWHFARCFIESGAFYTLKHMIMFEGLSLQGASTTDSLEILNQYHVGGYFGLYRSLNL